MPVMAVDWVGLSAERGGGLPFSLSHTGWQKEAETWK